MDRGTKKKEKQREREGNKDKINEIDKTEPFNSEQAKKSTNKMDYLPTVTHIQKKTRG